jgi:hypothetical protein
VTTVISKDLTDMRRDLAWEALVRVTHANPAVERGVLNAALKAIREPCASPAGGGILDDGMVAVEIESHAELYRQTFPGIVLTPMALAKHWFRVQQGTGGSVSPRDAYEIARRELEA